MGRKPGNENTPEPGLDLDRVSETGLRARNTRTQEWIYGNSIAELTRAAEEWLAAAALPPGTLSTWAVYDNLSSAYRGQLCNCGRPDHGDLNSE
jgi:hypothetical protein